MEKEVKNAWEFRPFYYNSLEIQDEINMGKIWGKSPHFLFHILRFQVSGVRNNEQRH